MSQSRSWAVGVRSVCWGRPAPRRLAWRAADPDRARADITELTGLFETSTLHAAVETLPLAEAAQAHRLLEDRAVLGRLLLVP